MKQFTIQEIECNCCTGNDKIKITIGHKKPEEYLCEFCIRGIALLQQDDEAEWIKVAMIYLPGDHKIPFPITSNDTKLEGININHRTLMQTDQVEVFEPEEDSEAQELRSEVGLKCLEKTGLPGFTLTRALMNTPTVKKLYKSITDNRQVND